MEKSSSTATERARPSLSVSSPKEPRPHSHAVESLPLLTTHPSHLCSFDLLIGRRRRRSTSSSMATIDSTATVSSEGLRNRHTQSTRTDDSPRSDATQHATPTLDQHRPDSKDNTDPSHRQVKVLGRTPDGTGKYCWSLHPFPPTSASCMRTNPLVSFCRGLTLASAQHHHDKRKSFGLCPLCPFLLNWLTVLFHSPSRSRSEGVPFRHKLCANQTLSCFIAESSDICLTDMLPSALLDICLSCPKSSCPSSPLFAVAMLPLFRTAAV